MAVRGKNGLVQRSRLASALALITLSGAWAPMVSAEGSSLMDAVREGTPLLRLHARSEMVDD